MSVVAAIAGRAPTGTESRGERVLGVADLVVEIGGLRAVDGVSFAVERGRTLCLVGESGCGKSMTCLAVLGQLPPGARLAGGTIERHGSSRSDGPVGRARPDVAMIHQDATASLNPVLAVGGQVAEPLAVHFGLPRAAARAEALRLLDRVGLPDARRRYAAFPHELSGGMNQRVAIARALACRPEILLADEPTTALDVTVQAQILDLLRDIQAETGLGLLFVTHDLGVVAEIADEVAVMYAGRIVEAGPVETVFDAPAHPYTGGLLACLPTLSAGGGGRLAAIPGTVPPLRERPPGCAFAPRCPQTAHLCRESQPAARLARPGATVSCFFPNAAPVR